MLPWLDLPFLLPYRLQFDWNGWCRSLVNLKYAWYPLKGMHEHANLPDNKVQNYLVNPNIEPSDWPACGEESQPAPLHCPPLFLNGQSLKLMTNHQEGGGNDA